MRKLLFVVLLILLSLLCATAGLAQDVSVDATEVATEVPPPVETPAPVEMPIPPDAIFLSTGQLLAYLALAIFGGGGLMAIGYRFLELRQARDITEKLFEGLAPEQQELISRVVAGYEETNRRLLDFLKAVTDRLPNEALAFSVPNEATALNFLNVPWSSLDERGREELRKSVSEIVADNTARTAYKQPQPPSIG